MKSKADKVAASELILYAVNDGGLYENITGAYINLLARKMQKGAYSHDKARKLWARFADIAAKEYHKEHGSMWDKWHSVFNKATRTYASVQFADYYLESVEFRANNWSKAQLRG